MKKLIEYVKTRAIIILIILTAILGVSLFVTIKYSQKQRYELVRAENNYTAIVTDADTLRTKVGQFVSDIRILRLTVSELKQKNAKAVNLIYNLNIKLKNVSSVGVITTKIEYRIKAVTKDSLIHDSVAQCFEYKDAWTKIEGCVLNKRFDGNFSTVVPITIIGNIRYNKALFFRWRLWGIESIRQTVVCDNPKAIITANEFMQIEK